MANPKGSRARIPLAALAITTLLVLAAARADAVAIDGGVGLDDIAEILAATGTTHPAADLNGDGAVGLDDAAAALGQLGAPPGPSAQACAGTGPCF